MTDLSGDTLALIFLGLMGLTVMIYAILDGYDLGVGLLFPMQDETQRDQMIASIGPFWDANETWLVLAVGILLIAFPSAHSLVLRELYLPSAFMLIGLIARGVAFDFRAKAMAQQKRLWDWAFKLGSLFVALAQGYMLGRYVTGFEHSASATGFALLSAVCVAAAYAYIGGAWLVMKTSGDLQRRAARWTRRAGWLTALGILAVSIANLLISNQVAERWLTLPNAILLLPLPLVSVFLLLAVDYYLRRVPLKDDAGAGFPFLGIALLFVISFIGLAYSYFPYVVPYQLLATDAASAASSLRFILVGVVIVLPLILAYTVFSYRVFWGKSSALRYY